MNLVLDSTYNLLLRVTLQLGADIRLLCFDDPYAAELAL